MNREVVARNFATHSENRIHSDEAAREYGLRGGLVPGITVYGYLASEDLLRRGPVRIRFIKPVFDGDLLSIQEDADCITAFRDGEACAVLTVGGPQLELPTIPERPLPLREQRPKPGPETLRAGWALGTLHGNLESEAAADNIPAALLSLANRCLMDNFRLDPWMHVGSEISHRSAIQWGDPSPALAASRSPIRRRAASTWWRT